MNMSNIEDIDKAGTQRYTDAFLFKQWCDNFFEISRDIKTEYLGDKHHCRWFFIAIWELSESGCDYLTREMSLPQNANSDYLDNARKNIDKLKALYTDIDYFMLQYYRHSASHIFQHNYSWLDRKGNLNPFDRKFSFQDKAGNKKQLTNLEIRDMVKKVLGEYGSRESLYRDSLIKRAFEPIQAWADSQQDIVTNL